MKINLTDHVLRLAKAAPSTEKRRAVYTSVVREGRASAGFATVRPTVSGGIPVRKVKIGTLEAALKVRFAASQDSRPGPLAGGRADLTRKEPPGPLTGVSRRDIEALQRMEPDLLKWIGARKENAARFFADPVGSLDLARIKVARGLRLRILASRKRTMSLRVKLPPVRIRSIEVGV